MPRLHRGDSGATSLPLAGKVKDYPAEVHGLSTRVTAARSYLLLCAGVGVLMVGQTVNHLWSNLDFWIWLGAVREFAHRPLHPGHPLVASDSPDSYMGPWSFIIGLIVRWTSVDAVRVVAVGALANLVLVMGGMWRLARTVSGAKWAPHLALIFTLLAWGWHPLQWSGYLNLSSLGMVLPLGSTFAVGLALLAMASVWTWSTCGGDRHLLFVSLALPMVVLTHQTTGLWAVLLSAGILAGNLQTADRHRLLKLGAAGVVALFVLLFWPWYSIRDLTSRTNEFDALNVNTYEGVIAGAFLATPGLLALAERARASRRDPLLIGALLTGGVFAFGWATERGSLGRVFPGLMLVAHLAMADWFGRRLDNVAPSTRARWNQRLPLAAIVVVGVWGTAIGWVRSVPRDLVSRERARGLQLTSYIAPNLPFAQLLHDGDIVAAEAAISLPVAGSGAKVVAVGIPEPFISDIDERVADVAEMLNPGTATSERSDLLARYDVNRIVVRDSEAAALTSRIAGATTLGEVNGYTVIGLPRAVAG